MDGKMPCVTACFILSVQVGSTLSVSSSGLHISFVLQAVIKKKPRFKLKSSDEPLFHLSSFCGAFLKFVFDINSLFILLCYLCL